MKLDKAEYSKWLDFARSNIDVKSIADAFIKKEDYFGNLDFEKEEAAREKIFKLMEARGYSFNGIEDLFSHYAGEIIELYTQMGLKVGARLEVENWHAEKDISERKE